VRGRRRCELVGGRGRAVRNPGPVRRDVPGVEGVGVLGAQHPRPDRQRVAN
jgi:hypothetical protein